MPRNRIGSRAGRRVLVSLALVMTAIPALAQQAVIIVRHAEQEQTGGGMMDGDPPLNEKGRLRAAALAEHLRDAGVDVIVTSQYLRARETVGPLSAALKLQPETVLKDDGAGLTRVLKKRESATVLVVGHSDTIPGILTALGHPTSIDFPKTEFNNAWLVVPRAQGVPLVTRIRF